MLRATTTCTFSTSQLPKVVREWCVLYILTSKCASRHNGVLFFISHLASWLRTRRFSEPTFRPSGAPNHWKNTMFQDFPTFSRICIFFLLIFSLLTLLTSAFQLSISSEVSLLNFLRFSCWDVLPTQNVLVADPETQTDCRVSGVQIACIGSCTCLYLAQQSIAKPATMVIASNGAPLALTATHIFDIYSIFWAPTF